jgi:hypothetical protein
MHRLGPLGYWLAFLAAVALVRALDAPTRRRRAPP